MRVINKALATGGAVMFGAVTIVLERCLMDYLLDVPQGQPNGSAVAPAARHAEAAAAAATSPPAGSATPAWFLFAGVVAVMIILAVVSYQISKAYDLRMRARDTQVNRQHRWDEAMTVWNDVRAAVTAAETDPRAATERPLLCDVAEPATAQFWQAFARAEAAYSDTIPGDDEAIDEFTTAAEAARQAFETADTNAREKISR